MSDALLKRIDIDGDIKIGSKRQEAFAKILILICVFSCFTQGVAAGIIEAVTALVFMFLDITKKQLFSFRGAKSILIISVLSAVLALINKNYLGFLSSGLFLAMMVVANSARSLMSKKFFDTIIDTAVSGGVLATLYSTVEKYIIYREIDSYRSMALFPNPNFLGAALTLVILLCAYRISTNAKNVYIYYIAAFINAFGILNCGSMSLWVVAFIGVVILFILTKKYLLLTLLLSAAAICLFALISFPQLFGRLDEMGATTDNRIKIWSFAFERFKESPVLGRGFFSYKHLYNQYKDIMDVYKASLSHNIILDSLLCHGILGTLIFVSAVFGYLKDLFICRKNAKMNKESIAVSSFIISVLIAVFLYGMIDTTLVWMQGGMIFLFIASSIGAEEKV